MPSLKSDFCINNCTQQKLSVSGCIIRYSAWHSYYSVSIKKLGGETGRRKSLFIVAIKAQIIRYRLCTCL